MFYNENNLTEESTHCDVVIHVQEPNVQQLS